MTDIGQVYARSAELQREAALQDEETRAVQAEANGVPDPAVEHAVTGWPEPLRPAAYHGLVGEIVRTLDPVTETDPAAVLFSVLAAFGSAVGGSPFFRTEADRQTANLYVVLVGRTASGRKGTSWGLVRRLMKLADSEWTKRVLPGLSSGEGLIWEVRDPIERQQPVKEKGRVVDYESVVEDHGVSDKRLLAYQSEFASTLRVLGRDGNTLSAVMREAWDRGDLGTLTKSSPARSTGAHISLLGHISKEELLKYFDSTEAANGWGNRILWPCVRRSKSLPDGGSLPDLEMERLGKRLGEALNYGRNLGEMLRTQEARALWHEVYGDLTRERAGLLGSVTARGAAQVVRLALLYSLMDRRSAIGEEHLRAGLAAWDYAEESARYIFGESVGDRTADKILEELRKAPGGCTATEIGDIFWQKKPAREVHRALEHLAELGLAELLREATAGRPVERWRAL